MRTVKDCEYLVHRINNVRPMRAPELVFSQRNGYKAIDYVHGKGYDTLASGLTTGEAYEVLNGIYGYMCATYWHGITTE